MNDKIQRINQLSKILNASNGEWLDAQRVLETPGAPDTMPLLRLAAEKRQAASELVEILARIQIENP